MKTCKDCLHIDVCVHRYRKLCSGIMSEDLNNACTKFKDRNEYEKVVRCKNCDYKFVKNGHNKKGCPLDGVGFMNDNDFCSCGERKDG